MLVSTFCYPKRVKSAYDLWLLRFWVIIQPRCSYDPTVELREPSRMRDVHAKLASIL